MKWDVRGAWRADGRQAELVVEAPNQRAGELVANQRGLVVESCWPIAGAAADVGAGEPARRGGLASRLLRNLGLLTAVLGALAAGLGFVIDGATGEWMIVDGAAGFILGTIAFAFFGLLAWRAGRQ